MPAKSHGRLPSRRVVVHARSDCTDHVVLLGNGGALAADAAFDGSELASFDPLEHVDLPCIGPSGVATISKFRPLRERITRATAMPAD